MEEYLKNCFQMITKCGKFCKGLHVVMGNESGDLDSVVSSLVYAYLLQTVATENPPVIPVLNFLAKELALKTEVTYYLKRNAIPLDTLVFRDSLDLEDLHTSGQLQVILTDHHVMPSHTASLRSSVVEVVDHHPQDPAWFWPPETTTLQKVGSCCTLVAKKVLDRCPKLLNLQVASLLYGPIVLDTACFNPTADKTTPLDLEMAGQLEQRGVDGSKKELLFAELLEARSDISALTSAQLLMKDMKVTSGIPMPGFPILVQEFVKRPEMLPALKEFCADKGTSVAVLLGLKIDGDSIQRDLAVFNLEAADSAQQVVDSLLNSKDPTLQLEPVQVEVPGLQLFRQLNVKASRKQILPIVKEVGQMLTQK